MSAFVRATFLVGVPVCMQGVDDSVPAHLRGEGLVHNRRMGKKELNQMVTRFWKYLEGFSHDQSQQMVCAQCSQMHILFDCSHVGTAPNGQPCATSYS